MEKKPHLKKIREVVEKRIGNNGLEQISIRNDASCYVVVAGKQRFVLLYERFISAIADIGHTDIKVFHSLCFKLDANNSFNSNKMLVDTVAAEVNLSPNTVRNSITNLKKSCLIHQNKDYRSNYIIPPEFIWQGNTKNKQNVFKMILMQNLQDRDAQIVNVDGSVTRLKRGNVSEEEIERSFRDGIE